MLGRKMDWRLFRFRFMVCFAVLSFQCNCHFQWKMIPVTWIEQLFINVHFQLLPAHIIQIWVEAGFLLGILSLKKLFYGAFTCQIVKVLFEKNICCRNWIWDNGIPSRECDIKAEGDFSNSKVFMLDANNKLLKHSWKGNRCNEMFVKVVWPG